MADSENFLKYSEIGGIFFVVLLGSFLHFTYELSGGSQVVALFSAVNESVWEHLKLAFFPALVLAVFQYAYVRQRYPNFFLGKSVGIFAMPAIIVIGFYGYESIFHTSNTAYDIGLFIASVVAGQLISYRLVTKYGDRRFNPLPVLTLVVYAAAFFVFTLNPPHLEIFRDPVTGGYGLHSH